MGCDFTAFLKLDRMVSTFDINLKYFPENGPLMPMNVEIQQQTLL
jgi:hypothetical protein